MTSVYGLFPSQVEIFLLDNIPYNFGLHLGHFEYDGMRPWVLFKT